MATITNNIRWADNTAELKKNLLEGIGTIDAMKSSVMRTVDAMGGNGLFREANKLTAAVQELGGATKLTTAEKERLNATLEKAIEKYRVMGMTAPPAMKDLADATKQADDRWAKLGVTLGTALGALSGASLVAAGKQLLDYADKVTNVSEKTKFSTDAVQALTLAFQPHGIAIEAVATANEKLAKNLVGGDKATVTALQKMGLSISDLKAMSPDDLFLTVADAVGQIQNPTEQAFAAMTVFGKGGAELLAGLDGHLRDTTQSFKDMGLIIDEQTIKAADDFGDQLGMMGKQLLGITATIIGPLLPALSTIGNALMWLGNNIIGPVLNVSVKTATTLLASLWYVFANVVGKIADLGSHLPGVGGKFAELAASMKSSASGAEQYVIKLWDGTDKVADSATKAHTPLLGLGKDVEDVGAKAKKTVDEGLKPIAGVVDALHGHFSMLSVPIQDNVVHLDEMRAKFDAAREAAENLDSHTITLNERETATGAIIGGDVIPAFDKLIQGSMPQATAAIDAARESTDQTTVSVSSLADMFVRMGQAAQGSLGQALGMIGQIIVAMDAANKTGTKWGIASGLVARNANGTADMATRYATGLALAGAVADVATATEGGQGKAKGALSGAAAGAKLGTMIMPGWGTAIGAGVGAVVGLVRNMGVSKEEKEGRQNVQDFEKQLSSLLSTTQRLEAGGVQWKMTQIAVRDAYVATGHSTAEAEAAVKRLWDSSKKGAEEQKAAMAAINQAFSDQAQDAADLKDAIQEYGFSFEELGPKLQKQQLTEQAVKLENQFRLLVGAGIDTGTVIEHMSGNLNEFVQTAVRTGQQVPEEMRPILQKMIDMGELVDANGDKITDLGSSGISFSETMTQGFDRIVNALRLVAQGLGVDIPDAMSQSGTKVSAATEVLKQDIGKVSGAFDNVRTTGVSAFGAIKDSIDKIPRQIDIDMVTNLIAPDTSYGSMGGLVTANGIQYFTGGGNVLPFVPRGMDTIPAMLAPGEFVLSRGDTALFQRAGGVRALRSGGGSSGGAQVVSLDTQRLEKRLERLQQQMVVESRRSSERIANGVRDGLMRAGISRGRR